MNNLIKLFMYFFYYSTTYNNIVIEGIKSKYFTIRDYPSLFIYEECDVKTKVDFFVQFFKENEYFHVFYEKFN